MVRAAKALIWLAELGRIWLTELGRIWLVEYGWQNLVEYGWQNLAEYGRIRRNTATWRVLAPSQLNCVIYM
jgi:hypothetical protein